MLSWYYYQGRPPGAGRLGSSPTRPDPTRPDRPGAARARPDPDRAKEKATRRSPEIFWFPLLRLSSTVPVIIG